LRKGHDLHYGLNGEKLGELGWIHPIGFDLSLMRTVNWYMENKEWLGL